MIDDDEDLSCAVKKAKTMECDEPTCIICLTSKSGTMPFYQMTCCRMKIHCACLVELQMQDAKYYNTSASCPICRIKMYVIFPCHKSPSLTDDAMGQFVSKKYFLEYEKYQFYLKTVELYTMLEEAKLELKNIDSLKQLNVFQPSSMLKIKF